MKKILIAALWLPLTALAQSYPSPHFNNVTIDGTLTAATPAFTNPVPVTSGGTGAATASGARTNLSAAASGANSDITSLTGLTTPLSVAQGGSGLATIPQYNVLLGSGTGAVSAAAPSATAGLPLVSNGSAANPSFAVAVPAGGGTGLATLAAHGVMLGEGTANISSATPGVAGYALLSNGSSSDPSFQQLIGAQVNYNQGNVNAVTRTVTNRLQERISVMDFGCDNTGASDDSTCFANTVAALPSSGGTIYMPPGIYLVNAFPSLASKTNITFKGAGGVTAGAQAATEIKIGLTGAGNFINGAGSAGLAFEDIQFVYSSSAFTGWIMAFGNNGTDAAFVRIKRCAFLSNSSSLFTASAINMDKTIVWSVEDSVFAGLQEAIQGYTAASGDYSNVATIARNQFSNTRYAPIEGGGQSWVIANNNFEGFNNGTTGNVIAGSLGMTSAVSMQGLQYVGNWHGDLNAAGGTWITVFGGGIDINNNWFGGIAGSNAISANNVQGLRVASNYFTTFGTALSFDTAGNTGVSYMGNQFVSVTNQIANPGNYSGMTLNGANLSVTGTGVMPLYTSAGGATNAPHMVFGSVALSAGSATVSLSGSAVFTSGGSFVCNATDLSAANPVKVSAGSGTSVSFSGTGTDSVQYMCVGN